MSYMGYIAKILFYYILPSTYIGFTAKRNYTRANPSYSSSYNHSNIHNKSITSVL